tara:strand:+ start:543 stop:863 length:321 start_codon:yes stop_codon:yes gene_type:complete
MSTSYRYNEEDDRIEEVDHSGAVVNRYQPNPAEKWAFQLLASQSAVETLGGYEPGAHTVDCYRKDLKHQLSMPDELDWDYLVATAKKAQAEANRTGVNMVFGAEAG